MLDTDDLIPMAAPQVIIHLAILDDSIYDTEVVRRNVQTMPLWDVVIYSATKLLDFEKLLTKNSIDIALVDNRLGAASGTELISQWCLEFPNVAFVLMTGIGDETVAANAFRSGALDYIVKSNFSGAELERCFVHALERSKDKRRLNLVMDTVLDAIVMVDPAGCIKAANPAANRMFAYTANDFLQVNIADLVRPIEADEQQKHWWQEICNANSSLLGATSEVEGVQESGKILALEMSLVETWIAKDRLFVGVIRNVTARKAMEQVNYRQALIIDSVNDAIVFFSPGGYLLDINPAGRTLLEIPLRDELAGVQLIDFLMDNDKPRVQKDLLPALFSEGSWRGEVSLVTCENKQIIPTSLVATALKNNLGVVTNWVAIIRNIRSEKVLQTQLKEMAEYDALTGLANRALFNAQLQQFLARSKRQKTSLAVMFIDLDRFKNVNDTLGHGAGDELLLQVGKRLQKNTRDADLVARLGGDEFVILIESYDDGHGLDTLAIKLLEALGEVYLLSGHQAHVTPSIGIATYPDNADSVEGLLKCADEAMYKAKKNGRNEYQFYSNSMRDSAIRYRLLRILLEKSLVTEAMRIKYQPIFNQQRQLVGAEALLRMPLDETDPEEFIPLAEHTGLINPLGDWVIKQVIAKASRWRRELGFEGFVSVNTSLLQFQQKRFGVRLMGWLQMHNLPNNALVLELTESQSLGNVDSCMRTFRDLTDFHVPLAIDDFGSGYASFKHLEKLPLEFFKIDKSFVQRLDSNGESAGDITRAMIVMAEAMNLQVIAEGIETKAQAAWFVDYPNVWLQGFYYAEPTENFEQEYLRR